MAMFQGEHMVLHKWSNTFVFHKQFKCDFVKYQQIMIHIATRFFNDTEHFAEKLKLATLLSSSMALLSILTNAGLIVTTALSK